jgi:hypothetical protein
MFMAVLLFTGLGTVPTWHEIPAHITTVNVSAFALSIITFLKTMYTAKPRDPNVGTRRTDPNPTAPIVSVGGEPTAVPPVNPGRPVDPEKANP